MGEEPVEPLADRSAHRTSIAQIAPDGSFASELHPVDVRREVGRVAHLEGQHPDAVRGPGETLDPARHEAEHGVLAVEDLCHEEELQAFSSAMVISPRA